MWHRTSQCKTPDFLTSKIAANVNIEYKTDVYITFIQEIHKARNVSSEAVNRKSCHQDVEATEYLSGW